MLSICGSGRKTGVLRPDTQLLSQELLVEKVHYQDLTLLLLWDPDIPGSPELSNQDT